MIRKRKLNVDGININVYCNKHELDSYKVFFKNIFNTCNGLFKYVVNSQYDELVINSYTKAKSKKSNKLYADNIECYNGLVMINNIIDGLDTDLLMKKNLKEVFLEEENIISNDKNPELLKSLLYESIKTNDFSNVINYVNCKNETETKAIIDKYYNIKLLERNNIKFEMEKKIINATIEETIKNNYFLKNCPKKAIQILKKYRDLELPMKIDNTESLLNEKLSKETILSLVKEVLSAVSTNDEFLKKFESEIDRKRIIVFDKDDEKICKEVKTNLNVNEIEYIYIVNRGSGNIICPLEHNLFDVICILHEFGHILDHDKEKSGEFIDNSLIEFSSTFLELIGTHYLIDTKRLNDNEKNMLKSKRLNANIELAKSCDLEIQIFDTYLNKGKIDDNILDFKRPIEALNKKSPQLKKLPLNSSNEIIEFIYNIGVKAGRLQKINTMLSYIISLEIIESQIEEKGIKKVVETTCNIFKNSNANNTNNTMERLQIESEIMGKSK